MATAAYPVAFFMHTQRARAHLYADGSAVVQTATQEFGTGMATVMTQVAADGLGVDLRDVRFEFGDTDLPDGRLAGRLERRGDGQRRRAQRRHRAARPAHRAGRRRRAVATARRRPERAWSSATGG